MSMQKLNIDSESLLSHLLSSLKSFISLFYKITAITATENDQNKSIVFRSVVESPK